MGAGKSTVGMRLAQELGWAFVDLDEEIVRAERKNIAEIFETAGEASFRQLEHLALADALRRSGMVLALGGGAVETEANRQLLTGDPETLLLYLEAPLDVLLDRCEQQYRFQSEAVRRPILERRSELTGRFLRRKPLYESAHWTIETAECDPDEIVRIILTRWKERTGSEL
jgi:shikimate kinase